MPTSDLADLDVLLGETSFRIDLVAHNFIPVPWVPVAHRSLYDKIYIPTQGRAWMTIGEHYYDMAPGRVFIFPAGAIQMGDPLDKHSLQKFWLHFSSHTTTTLHLLSLFPPPEMPARRNRAA